MLELVRDAIVILVIVGIIGGIFGLITAGIIANRRMR